MDFLKIREMLWNKRIQLKNELEKAKNQEYDEGKKQIEKEIKMIEETIMKINKVLFKYSLFDARQIGKIISNLMSIYENEKYEYIIKELYVTYVYADSWGSNEEVVKEEVALLYRKNFNISKIKLAKDLEKIDGLVLLQKIYIDEIRFYNPNGKSIIEEINNKYNYIQDFLNFLICKKIEKKKEKLTFEQMQVFLKEYIILHKEKIKNNYQKRILNKV